MEVKQMYCSIGSYKTRDGGIKFQKIMEDSDRETARENYKMFELNNMCSMKIHKTYFLKGDDITLSYKLKKVDDLISKLAAGKISSKELPNRIYSLNKYKLE